MLDLLGMRERRNQKEGIKKSSQLPSINRSIPQADPDPDTAQPMQLHDSPMRQPLSRPS